MCIVVLLEYCTARWRRGGRGFVHGLLLLLAVMLMSYALIRWVLGPTLRYSIYYKHADPEHVLRQDRERQLSADVWARRWQWRVPPLDVSSSLPRPLCLAYLTAPRDGLPSRYASHALRSIFEPLNDEEAGSLYTVAVVRGQSPCPAILDRFHTVIVKESSQEQDLNEETLDYVTALDACIASKSPYILVLEDDVWSTKHLVRKVLLDVIRLGDEKEESWIVIKVFQHEFWQGWDWDYGTRLGIFSGIVTLASVAWTQWYLWKQKGFLKRLVSSVLIGACICFFTAWVPYAVGRQHIIPVFVDGLNKYYPSATVAILYNNSRPGVMSSLVVEAQKKTQAQPPPIDLALDEWLKVAPQNLFGKFVYAPSLVQHVGLTSSLRHKAVGNPANEETRRMLMKWRVDIFKQSLTWRED